MTPPLHRFAARTDWELAPNTLSQTLQSLRESNTPVLDLTESNPTRCGLTYPALEILQPLSQEENLCYAPSPRGILEARRAVSRYYEERKVRLPPEHIFLTSGTSEAYSHLFRLLADPGGEVLFPRPSYPLFAFLGELNDVRMAAYPLVYDAGWRIDLDGLRRAFSGRTRALVLVNPNNPTGSFVRPGELDEINALCRAHNTALICDEVFADFAFDPGAAARRVSLAGNNSVLTFVLGGISKAMGLPQMKVAWTAVSGPADAVEAAGARLEVICDTYLSVSTPAQNALPAWLSGRHAIQDEINARLRQNYGYLKEKAAGVPGCRVLEAGGGWYAVVNIPAARSEEQWALTFLREDHVFVHPGYFFDFPEEAFIVVGLLPSPDVFTDGINRIFARLGENK